MIDELSKAELIGIARILFTAENELMPEFEKELKAGKEFGIDEYCEKVIEPLKGK